ncbi:hypothetical protein BD626DRAFT_501923 [Schizophyllum amplum]|uniref:HSF-type DNA-binding domain-containing protein n=1 Tax=Schizophyllum amplum TaxID=97359 RepID=A0A550C8W7_9AGAR|nr:hypothetical protein BD626DRAFT_501923 [Auriculariopsis ampla]
MPNATPTNQVALTNRNRAAATNARNNRQVVPAFLQKLHEMVNDPKNEALIRWSDTGDSFFVLDHERFAREVLGRWFKHQNFSSFVRQLNMYGFHKVQHLQQGTLRSSESEGNEFWNFAHPNFLRGRADLLALIQRKKQAQNGEGDAAVQDVASSSTAQGGQQVLDINSIVAGLAAIKRHQDIISTELTHLRENNNLLWQEAMEARARAKKQQDTINRIVKFLAGIFGNHQARNKHNEEEESEGASGSARDAIVPHSVMSHMNATVPQMQRLMIEDKRPYNSVDIEEIEDDEQHLSKGKQREYSTGYRVETPPASTAAATPGSPAPTEGSSFFRFSTPVPSPVASGSTPSANSVAGHPASPVPSSRHATPPVAPSPSVDSEGRQLVSSHTPPYRASASPGPLNGHVNPDDLHTIFNNLSSTQINSLMSNLPGLFSAGAASSPGPSYSSPSTDYSRPGPSGADAMSNYAPATGTYGGDPGVGGMGGVEGLLSFDHPSPGGFGHGMDYDYSAGYGYGPSGFADSSQPTAFINEPSAFISGSDHSDSHAVAQGAPPVPNWQAAEDIDRDVSALNAKINTLIENTSPIATQAQPVAQAAPAPPWLANAASAPQSSGSKPAHPVLPAAAMHTEPLPAPLDSLTPDLNAPADFDFTEFLSKYVSGVEGAQDNNALMDEVMSNAGDSTGHPAVMDDVQEPTTSSVRAGRKRKSDVSPIMPELGEPSKKGGKRRRAGA